mmetsp:Transcript_19606/g.42854  ORF Transcript_19606/g.42854 Transcript_19606/m.42854 type:complete len:219 (+) Transcript_19606:142-798(+)
MWPPWRPHTDSFEMEGRSTTYSGAVGGRVRKALWPSPSAAGLGSSQARRQRFPMTSRACCACCTKRIALELDVVSWHRGQRGSWASLVQMQRVHTAVLQQGHTWSKAALATPHRWHARSRSASGIMLPPFTEVTFSMLLIAATPFTASVKASLRCAPASSAADARLLANRSEKVLPITAKLERASPAWRYSEMAARLRSASPHRGHFMSVDSLALVQA